MLRSFILFQFLLLSGICIGQVVNNNIENRIRLTVDDEWFQSSTTSSNVEWDCISKTLTSSCLVYHNDQWFTFSIQQERPYYINISNQNCKNRQGVQIVVIEGDPCQIDTYRLIECIPYTDQSDMYVRLENLKPDVDYLVNIDGYLGDLCDFQIQVSSYLHGIPSKKSNLNVLKTEVASSDSIVTLNWKLPDSLLYRISSFSVHRKRETEKSFLPRRNIPIHRNALGKAAEHYTLVDTIRKYGSYEYLIFGQSNHNEGLLLLGSASFVYREKFKAKSVVSHQVEIPFNSKSNKMVFIDVYDSTNDQYLFSTTRRSNKGLNRFYLDLTRYVNDGIFFFKVVATNKDDRTEQRFSFKDAMSNKKTQSN